VAQERHPATLASVALCLAVFGVALVLAWVVAPRAAPPRRDERPGARVVSRLVALLLAGNSLAAALLVALRVRPLRFVRLHEGELIASVLFTAGGLAVVLDSALCRALHVPAMGRALRAAPGALLAVCALYVAAVLTVDREFYHLSFGSLVAPRLGIGAVLALAVYPFFASYERLLGDHDEREPSSPRRAALVFARTCGCYVILATALGILAPRLERFSVPLALAGIASALLGLAFGRRSPEFAPWMSALGAAWVLAVGFVRY
jgi:hypothetical protein